MRDVASFSARNYITMAADKVKVVSSYASMDTSNMAWWKWYLFQVMISWSGGKLGRFVLQKEEGKRSFNGFEIL